MSNTIPKTGQINPETIFGITLKQIAKRSRNIVEIGASYPGGSTDCLIAGLREKNQKIWSIEMSKEFAEQVQPLYEDPRVEIVWGRVIPIDQIRPYDPETDTMNRQIHEIQTRNLKQAPFILYKLPKKIDLLLIDGSPWASEAELEVLINRCKYIALDDCNRERARKNPNNRQRLIDEGWILVRENMVQRNGWAVFEKPNK